MAIYYDTPVQYLKGVGPRFADLLRKRSILTVGELLDWFPRSYEDRRAAREISSLRPEEVVSLTATIIQVRSFPMGKSRRRIYEVVVGDSSGKVSCRYFRIPYRGYFERFQPHQQVRVSGKVTHYRGAIQFSHPDIHSFSPGEKEEDRLVPLYTETEGLSPQRIRKIIGTAIDKLIDHPEDSRKYKEDPRIPGVPDALPSWLLEKYDLLSRSKALKQIHQPPVHSGEEFLNFKSPAQRRVIFDEFFWLELHLARRKVGIQKERASSMQQPSQRLKELLGSLPFQLTKAQERTLREVLEDLGRPHPMHRMVQGDVGSGKTVVALAAAVHVADNGFQSTLMVPTEILAEQHAQSAKKILGPLGIQVGLLSGKVKASERNQVLKDLESGRIDICIGTHALIQEGVVFRDLGLIIIDEQHRFGVGQRGRLKEKGTSPHFLVMTATPIPRTLAMTVYGDLDVSIIDELPQGRSPIVTRVTYESKRGKVMGFMADQIRKGRQAYIVYPLVEESEKIDLKNAVDEFENLKGEWSEFKIGLLHGKMKPAEKDQVMGRFRDGELDILVSTTVIEVGVDVPNTNLMIIEHAERFGLSQLHQLRGRVGRGEHKSYCVLMLGYAVSEDSRARAEVIAGTTDGFKIAEADLEMRGPGEFLGTRQSGLLGFRAAHLVRDAAILQEARRAAFEVVAQDPDLSREDHRALREELERQASHAVG